MMTKKSREEKTNSNRETLREKSKMGQRTNSHESGSQQLHNHRTSSAFQPLKAGDKQMHSNNGLSFVMVLHGDFSKELKLPDEFTRNFDEYSPHRYILESTVSEQCWRVEVEEDGDGRMYFRDGWGDFVEAQMLEPGNFLVFKYEERSIFQVKIYGTHGCEKTACMETNRDRRNLEKTTEYEDDGESEASEYEPSISEIQCQQKTRNFPPRKCYWTLKRSAQVSITGDIVRFSIYMRKGSEHRLQCLVLPTQVSRKMKLSCKEKIVVQDAKGNCWPVRLGHRSDGRYVLSRGWKTFVRDNGIACGDTLNFEFISDNVIQVHVTTPKGNREARGSLDLKDEHGIYYKQHAVHRRRKRHKRGTKVSITGDSVRFSISFDKRRKYRFQYANIPMEVSEKKKLSSKEKIVLQDAKGNCWAVKVVHKSKGRDMLSHGWSNFVRENEISGGDTVDFEFISDNLVQFHVTRNLKDEQHSEESEYTGEASQSLDLDGEYEEADTHSSEDEVARASATKSRISSDSTGSSFSFLWRKSKAISYLNIPKVVAKYQNLESKRSIILRDSGGKSWPLKVRHWHGKVSITAGWSAFWKARDIKEGDYLIFKFESECLIRVHIYRGLKPSQLRYLRDRLA